MEALSVPPGFGFPPPLPQFGLGQRQPQPSPPPWFTGGCGRRYRPLVPPPTWSIPGSRAGGSGAPQGIETCGSCHGWGTGGSFPPRGTPCSRAPPERRGARSCPGWKQRGADLDGPCLAYTGWASPVKTRGLFAAGCGGRAGTGRMLLPWELQPGWQEGTRAIATFCVVSESPE